MEEDKKMGVEEAGQSQSPSNSEIMTDDNGPAPFKETPYVFETKELINNHIRNEISSIKESLVDEVSQRVIEAINKNVDGKIEMATKDFQKKDPQQEGLERIVEKAEKHSKSQF